MATSTKRKRLLDAYRVAGFRAQEPLRGVFGDPYARVITLARRSKKRLAEFVDERTAAGTTAGRDEFATCPVDPIAFISSSKFDGWLAAAAAR